LGSIGFGGGMAVIALMEQQIARKRRLISVEEFAHDTARTKTAVVLASAAAALGLARVNAIWILLTAGALGLFWNRAAPPNASATRSSATLFTVAPLGILAVAPLLGLARTFLKIGCVFFGGGFVLVPLLYNHLLTQLHYLTEREFLDGVAISNLTPGPIAVLATFAGYKVASMAGALIATAVLFAPGFALMLVISHRYARFREDRRAKRFLSGINPTVAGLIFAAAILLALGALASWRGPLLCGISLVLLARFRWHPAFVLAIGAVAGLLGVSP
jgi:chromate transporter